MENEARARGQQVGDTFMKQLRQQAPCAMAAVSTCEHAGEIARKLTGGVLRLAASVCREKSWQDPHFLQAAGRAAARAEGCAFTSRPGGREHPFDHMRARQVKAALAVLSGPGAPLGTATYGEVGRDHDLEVVGSLPTRIKRRLRRSLSWREGENLPARYRWRCSHTDDESFLLRDGDELLDLVEERRQWLAGSYA